ncbi:cytochrome P450 [Perilla frutescens var. hirtella]|nr:cytochrome P450 [Perilla frutescens var. hirtella]
MSTVELWVVKLVQQFQWAEDKANPVDLSELLKLSCEMKYPLSNLKSRKKKPAAGGGDVGELVGDLGVVAGELLRAARRLAPTFTTCNHLRAPSTRSPARSYLRAEWCYRKKVQISPKKMVFIYALIAHARRACPGPASSLPCPLSPLPSPSRSPEKILLLHFCLRLVAPLAIELRRDDGIRDGDAATVKMLLESGNVR